MKGFRYTVASVGGVLLLMLLYISITWGAADIGAEGWIQYPTNDGVSGMGSNVTSSARLALVAAGSTVGMSYTPATYEIYKDIGAEYVELQVHDGDLIGAGGATGDYVSGSNARMMLVFESGGDWRVRCISETINTIAEPGEYEFSVGLKQETCKFPQGQWSDTLRIYPNSGSNTFRFKTVWADSKHHDSYGSSSYSDLINVFRFQTKGGRMQLAKTNEAAIRHNTTLAPIDFKTTEGHYQYQNSLNWVVLYNTSQSSLFSFEIDVTGMDYLYLWDKDADASKLWRTKGKTEFAKPRDDGVNMLVRWSDGSAIQLDGSGNVNSGDPITSDPEWTYFNQTERYGFADPTGFDSSHTNSYDGPSWDTDKDADGFDSIQWYKIPVSEQKSNKVMVFWSGFDVSNNGIAFAASGGIATACPEESECQTGEEEPEEDEEEKPHCPANGDDDCIEDEGEDDEEDESDDEYADASLKLTISSDPAPETANLKELGTEFITYTLLVQHIGDEALDEVELEFTNAPQFTLMSPETQAQFSKENKIIQYGGLDPGESFVQDLKVLLADVLPDEGTISTKDLIRVRAKEHQDVLAREIRHYLGDKPEELEEGEPGTTPKCEENGALRACIHSTPPYSPHPQSKGLSEGDTITYHLELRNISSSESPVELTGLNIGFEPALHTTLDDSLLSEIVPLEGGGSYTGKGKGRFDFSGSIGPDESVMKDVIVTIDSDVGMDDFDIVTEDRVTAGASNNPGLTLPSLTHSVGNGALNVTLTRCFAYDYIGGEFECSQSCPSVEPGTSITVRDTLANTGGQVVQNHSYFPTPLASAFLYQPNSVKIDDPILGLSIPNDGESFPPVEGITIPGPIEPGGHRFVYFRYTVPEDILEEHEGEIPEEGICFPEEGDEPEPPPAGFTDINYEPECLDEAEEGEKKGVICVRAEEDPQLEAVLTALPSEETTVYQGSSITYQLEIKNLTKVAVKEMQIDDAMPAQTQCRGGNCTGLSVSSPPELAKNTESYRYLYTVIVNPNAAGSSISHVGHVVTFSGSSGTEFTVQSNSLAHTLNPEPEPTGEFYHDITLTRRKVLNSPDGEVRSNQKAGDDGDHSTIRHEIGYEGTQKMSPELLQEGTRPYQVTKPFGSNCTYYKTYNAEWSTARLAYNFTELGPFQSHTSIRSEDMYFEIRSVIPGASQRPGFIMVPGSRTNETFTDDSHTYTFEINGSDQVNRYMRDGRVYTYGQLNLTTFRAVKDGQQQDSGAVGRVEASNLIKDTTQDGEVLESEWMFLPNGQRELLGTCSCGRRCTEYVYAPLYDWQRTSDRWIELQDDDTDYLSVLSSTAWVQTKNGHLGFGSSLWQGGLSNSDPNYVFLADRDIPSELKFFTPLGEHNADLYIFSPDGNDPLESRMGTKGKITTAIPQGFIDSPIESGAKQLSRGEAYDRPEFARSYTDDLINRQVYGEVIFLNQTGTLPAGVSRSGDTFIFTNQVDFKIDTIYHVSGNVQIGSIGGSDFTIAGGKARLYVDGSASINTNAFYSTASGADLAQTPSLRLHTTGDIRIDPSVTDVEMMMLSEGSFYSGRSDKQLRILGDVIAYDVHWQRSPLNNSREQQEMVNRPSELIYEDFRKYLVTPPGDKKLPDSGHIWREVNPSTGKPINEWVFE